MKDDFDNEMGLPDDELDGESSAETGEPMLGGLENDGDLIPAEPAGRASGGARAKRSSPARRAPAAPVKMAAKPAKKSAKAGKPAKKSAKMKTAKKAAKRRPAKKKAARKVAKKSGKRKAGKKR